jgi:putative hydrolase of the HAD superfamily
MKITILFLDIGGVLLNKGWSKESRILAAKIFKFDFNEFEKRHNEIFATYELGKVDLNEYLNNTVFYQKRSHTRAQFKQFMFSQSQCYPQMIGLFQQLKKKYGLKIVVVSNEAFDLNNYRIKKFKLNKLVDFFISSCFVQLRKPDPEIFRMALNISQASIDQVVYVEDTPMFVNIAENMGIKSILHTDFQSTCAKLIKLGLVSEQ